MADELYRCGYINECADAEGVIRACLARKYGKKRIIIKLRERGYENDVRVCELCNSVYDSDGGDEHLCNACLPKDDD